MKPGIVILFAIGWLFTFYAGIVGGFEIARRSPSCWIR